MKKPKRKIRKRKPTTISMPATNLRLEDMARGLFAVSRSLDGLAVVFHDWITETDRQRLVRLEKAKF
jgi:hypothetical protein